MLYMMADCYSRLNQYEKATAVYEKLSKYYVEQFDIRIELAKAMFAKGTVESYKQAKEIFLELSVAVAKPGSQNYKPKDFFNLQFWGTRAKLKAMGAKPPTDEVVTAWQYFRSSIYQDLGYFAKEERRFDVLKIAAMNRGAHHQLIDEIKKWVSENIFPVLKDSGHALASDSWEKILGAE
jgi:tetratricopeptide (TPR) repeat protein